MTKCSRLFGLGIVALLAAGCPNDKPYLVGDDAGVTPDAPPTEAPTFARFVIDLIENHSGDTTPATYDSFKDLPDPDAETNNTGAFSSLFQ